ncbi:uncharacterized protein LY89DRAFT_288129 [Mollisia scopiformis]|uniref:Uncharacterized protein n=1 Tax=Mollisia scopiformis TaxID=149040 RepID=A0A132BAL0_MOLSC|nr:uncharacterized protein LY89DRAFT_288129 [Mollisia scopiformis]KUJ09455.1 hypothetical protein LY89DRAFT_288129 [Mollisia scopiformis]
MGCLGICFGTVVQVSDVITKEHTFWKFEFDIDLAAHKFRAYHKFYNRWSDILGPLFAGGELSTAFQFLSQLVNSFNDGTHDVLRWKSFWASILSKCGYTNELVSQLIEDRESVNFRDVIAHLFLRAISIHKSSPELFARRFATLDTDKVVLVPEATLPGDVLCHFIEDVRTPYVLRIRDSGPEEDDPVVEKVIKEMNRPERSRFPITYCDFVGECFVYDWDYEGWLRTLTLDWSRAPYDVLGVFVMH